MKKTKMHNALRVLLMALLLCFLLSSFAQAAGPTGSLRVLLTDDDGLPVPDVTIVLYPVGDKYGTLNENFSAAGISAASLLSDRDNAENSALLASYVEDNELTGDEKTTSTAGRVFYDTLSEGVYLVLCKSGQELTFTPFLVQIPTVIGGLKNYNVRSYPKAETPADPDNPDPDKPVDPDNPDPVDPDNPDPDNPDPDNPDPDFSGESDTAEKIPQTGVNIWPTVAMFLVGLVLVILGFRDLWRSRREQDE